LTEILIIAIAYLVGSIPVGIILARHYSGKDITKEGSGNIGATNVVRVVGKKAGILTLFGDALKGIVPLAVSMMVTGDRPHILALVALAAFLGHLYPVFNRFRGGKGVATALGIFIFISPLSALAACILFGITVYLWRYVSLGSIVAAGSIPALVGIFSYSKTYILLALIMGGLVIYRHKSNIRRLLQGEENRLGSK